MKDINNIFDEKPKDQLWDRLNEKLATKKSARILQLYKIASLAAMLVALVAAVGYFKHVLNDHNPKLFASNGDFTGFVTEDLSHDDEGIFNMESLLKARTAYIKQTDPTSSPTLSGSYKANDGELSLQIKLQDFSYYLDFSYDDFPTFYLEKIEGQTLYFGSDINKFLKLNMEPYGLKLVDSDFLPEYKGYQFNRLKEI